jgi:O-antigen ligase
MGQPGGALGVGWRDGAERLGRVGCLVMAFGMPVSISITSLGAVMMLVGWLASFAFRAALDCLRGSHVVRAIALLVILATLGWLHSDADFEHAIRVYMAYLKCGLVAVIAYQLRDAWWLHRTFHAFVAGVTFTMVSTLVALWAPVPWAASQAAGFGNDLSVVSNYIVQSLTLVAFVWYAVGVGVGVEPSTSTRKRVAYFVLSAVAMFIVLFLLRGRTGLMALIMSVVAIAMVFSSKYRILVTSSVLLALSSLVYLSPTLWPNLQQGLGQIVDFKAMQDANNSWGARLSMYMLSLDLIGQAPLFGHGLGDYRTLSLAFYNSPSMQAISAVHPHNQFLFAWVELGLVALLAWVYLLWGVLRDCAGAAVGHRIFAIGVMFTLLADSLFHAPVWMGNERNIFIVLLGLVTAASLNSKRAQQSNPDG